ncbi:hypothetical protein FRC04_008324 [Tulasnella sp. 424]|nr:hypothetical protein FRC04_008324 [Tulasnella sp. 424]KAG8970297.1 hypothetical protein FRC05_000671 [Tulasnella sp. 425]
MPTGPDFEKALADTPERVFVFDISVPEILVRLDNWYLQLNSNSSDPSCLHFTYLNRIKTSIYIHLLPGELPDVMGEKLKRLLLLAVGQVKPEVQERRIVDMRRNDPAWSS